MTGGSIAVVIATRDRHASLPRALRSLRQQTRQPDEVIIVDDASVEPVEAERCQTELGSIPFSLLRNAQGLGPGASRNRGIEATRCDWISLLDDDDEFLPGKLAAIARCMADTPEPDVIYHPGIIFLAQEGITYTTRLNRLSPTPVRYRDLLVRNWIGGTPLVTVRRSLLEAVGGFDPALPACEDFDLWLRLAAKGAEMTAIDEPLTRCWITTREQSLSKRHDCNERAMEMIRGKHGILHPGTLTAAEQRAHRAWCLSSEVRRALFNYERRKAVLAAARKLKLAPSISDGLMLVALLLGPRFVFKMRAWLAPA